MPVGLMSNDGMNVVGNNLTLDNTSPWITYTGIWNFAVMGKSPTSHFSPDHKLI